jgi:hypothetical protein
VREQEALSKGSKFASPSPDAAVCQEGKVERLVGLSFVSLPIDLKNSKVKWQWQWQSDTRRIGGPIWGGDLRLLIRAHSTKVNERSMQNRKAVVAGSRESRFVIHSRAMNEGTPASPCREIAGGDESCRRENWSTDGMGFLCADPYLTRRGAGQPAIYVSSTRRNNQEVQTQVLRAGKWSERSVHRGSSRWYLSLFFLSLAAGDGHRECISVLLDR